MKRLLLLSLPLLFLTTLIFAGKDTATVTGNWSATGTWMDGTVPTSTDSVYVNDGRVLTVDGSYSCAYVELYRPDNGQTTLTVSSGNSLSITGDLDLMEGFVAGLFISNASLNIQSNATLTVGGNITYERSVPDVWGVFTMASGSTLNIGGILDTANSYTVTSTSTINYNGTVVQTINDYTKFTFGNILINNTSGSGASLAKNTSPAGDMKVVSGKLNNAGYTISALDTFSVSSGATLEISSGSFPTGANAVIINSGSTVLYSSGSAQNVDTRDYGNLSITGASTKTITGTNDTLKVAGTLTIGSGATLTGGTRKTVFNGSTITNNGTFTSSATGEQIFNASTTLSGAYTFGIVTINNTTTMSSGATFLGALDNNSTLTLSSTSSGTSINNDGTLNLNGTLSLSATMDNNSTLNVNGVSTFATLINDGTLNLNENTTVSTSFDNNNAIVGGGGNLTLSDISFDNTTGTYTGATGDTVKMTGTTARTITGGTIECSSLSISNTGGITISSGTVTVADALIISGGTLAAGGNLTLLSDASGTAHIAPISSGSITGNVTVERYIDTDSTGWHFLTSPVGSAQLGDWGLTTTGFTGSNEPFFSFVSIYSYDETVTGTSDNGYTAPSNITDVISNGEGFWVWAGDTSTGSNPYTIDVAGTPIQGNTSLPVTYTSSAGATHDGWCLVGNPYASEIDWSSGSWTKTNMNNAIYIWNPQHEHYEGYVSGAPFNHGTQYIGSGQAFWVQSNASSPALTITESCKSSNGDPFFKTTDEPELLRMSALLKTTDRTDEVVFNVLPYADREFNGQTDARKLRPSYNQYNPVLTLSVEDIEYSVKGIDATNLNDIVMDSRVPFADSVTISFNMTDGLDLGCIKLHDTKLDSNIAITDESSYKYYGETTDTNRFLIGAVKSNFYTSDTIYMTDNAATLELLNSSTSGVNYNWDFGDDVESSEFQPTHTYTSPGTYTVQLSSSVSGCEDVYEQEVVVMKTSSINSKQQSALKVINMDNQWLINYPFTPSTIVELRSIDGGLVFQKQVNETNNLSISKQNLSDGVYILSLNNEESKSRVIRKIYK